MLWDNIWMIGWSFFAGAVGGWVIVFIVIQNTSYIVRKKLRSKYEIKLNNEFLKHKAMLESRRYVSKTKYYEETQLYKKLSKMFFLMVKYTSELFPVSVVHSKDKEKGMDYYNKSKEAVEEAKEELYSSGAFISKEYFEHFLKIEKLCEQQIRDFERYRLKKDDNNEKEVSFVERDRVVYKRSREIKAGFDELLEKLREYMRALDVEEKSNKK